MSTIATNRRTSERSRTHRPLGPAILAPGVTLGVLGALIETASGISHSSTTPSSAPYTTSDYWFTASALPITIGLVLALLGVRSLQRARDGRLGMAGISLVTLSLIAICVVIVVSLAVGHDVSGGPTYMLGTLGSFIGLGLFAGASWRVGLVPRWLLAAWPVVWVFGSLLAVSASPVLLISLYLVLIAVVRRRSAG